MRAAQAMDVPSLNLCMKEDSLFTGFRRWQTLIHDFKPHMIQSLLIHSNLLGRATVFFKPEITLLSGISTVYTIEGYGRLYAWLERLTHPLDTRYIVNSELGRDKVLGLIGLPSGKIDLVHNGIETDVIVEDPTTLRVQVRREFGWDESHLVAGIVAQLRPAKRHDILIRAAARAMEKFPKIRLLIVGTGETEAPSKELAQREGIGERTIFTGYRSDARKLLYGMDLFALPSVVEGEPVSVMEAMDAGLPVVAAATGGIPEIVENGKSGLLSIPGDLNDFYTSLETALKDSAFRKEMGMNARTRVREHFSAQRMAAEFQQCYLQCAKMMGLT